MFNGYIAPPGRESWGQRPQNGGGGRLNKLALALTIVGGINWGLVALFRFDLVAWIFGGSAQVGSRIVYGLVALASLWCIGLLVRLRGEEMA